jgi:acid phosphatase
MRRVNIRSSTCAKAFSTYSFRLPACLIFWCILAVFGLPGEAFVTDAKAAGVGDIKVCYYCSNSFGLSPTLDGPAFIIENPSGTAITNGVLTLGPTGGSDFFFVGTIPAGSHFIVLPGITNDGQTGHSFFAVTGTIRDTSEYGPNADNTQFEFTGLQGSLNVDSGVFTPTTSKRPSNDGLVPLMNFLGGPGNNDGPCNDCYGPAVVATLTATAPTVHAPSHVVLVVEENGSYSTVTNSSDSTNYMPWLIGEGNAYGYAAKYYTDNAGSLLAYLWLSSGSCEGSACTLPPGDHNFGCTGGSCTSPITDDNIYRELIKRGMSWKLYAESIPYPGYMGPRITNTLSPYYQCCSEYDPHHNAPKWYSDIINSTTEQIHMVPFTEFATDLAAAQLPDYSIIIPNDLHDAEGGTHAQADAWLRTNLTPLLNSPYFQACGDGILIITFDNNDLDQAGHVYTAVIGPKVIPHTVSHTKYKHENTLRTILDAQAITTYPGYSATVTGMNDFFGPMSGCPK